MHHRPSLLFIPQRVTGALSTIALADTRSLAAHDVEDPE